MKFVLEVLFPYIFLLYVFDCITYVKARHVLLSTLFGSQFVLKGAGIHLAGLLPISQAIIVANLPVFCTRQGIYAVFDREGPPDSLDRANDFNFIGFEELESIEVEGKNIKFNNNHTLAAPSSSSARYHSEFINSLKRLSPAARIKKIKAHLSASYDLAAIGKIAADGSKPFAIIKMLGSFLFVLVFFILPTALYSALSGYFNLNAWAICALFIYLLLLLVTFSTLKKLYKSESNIKSHTLLSLILSPVNAIHALCYLTRDLYCGFNYLAVAAYYLPRNSFKELARKEKVLIDYFGNESDREDWLEFWGLKSKLLRGLLDRCEISLNELLASPEKQDQTAAYYCPFCMTEYREKRHDCIDCRLALREFP